MRGRKSFALLNWLGLVRRGVSAAFGLPQALALTMVVAPPVAQAQSVPKPNVIVPDGRTQTQVSVSGNVTNITTNTVSGNTGFNSFSQFREASGNVVNLQLPSQTNNLVNVVRDGPVVINGILNSYKNGKIGGNVFFADSYGFVVGSQGVVNTGGLTVATPTKSYLDTLIDPAGHVNPAAAAQLRSGEFPVSPDGAIRIKGRINAKNDVNLIGQSVVVAGGGNGDASLTRSAAQQRVFESAVNARGLRSGGAIVSRGGSLRIVAAGDVKIGGRLSANGTRHKAAGTISVTSGKSIAIAKTAQLSAKGYRSSTRPAVAPADGGTITVKAGTDLAVASGATFNASAGATGNGGFVELSAKNVAAIGLINLDVSAPHGAQGTLLLDPYNLVVGDPGNPGPGSVLTNDASYSFTGNLQTNGANVILTADNSITVTGIIDTRVIGDHTQNASATNVSTGSSGSISLNAPTITINGKLLADVYNTSSTTWTAGDVTLTAAPADVKVNSGLASNNAEISVAGIIRGGNITIAASAKATSSYTADTELFAIITAANLANPTGLDAGYVAASSTAKVTVATGASITGSGNISLTAHNAQTANDPAVNLALGGKVGAAVVVGQITGTTSVEVQSNATVNAGGTLLVEAKNNATLSPSALTISGLIGSQNMPADGAVVYGSADIHTSAVIHTGANISASGNVSVIAGNTNSFSVVASSYGFGGAKAGLTLAISNTSATVDARLGANLGASGTPMIGGVTVQGYTDTSLNQTTSSTTVGGSALAAVLAGISLAHDFYKAAPVAVTGISSLMYGEISGSAAGANASPQTAKVSGSGAFAFSDESTSASIAADLASAPADAPKVYASFGVAVVAATTDAAISSVATSTVNSNGTNPTASNPQATIGLAAAVAVGEFTHNTSAVIGPNVTVEGASVAVSATTTIPLSITYGIQEGDWSSLKNVVDSILGTFGSNPFLMTSGANAVSQGKDFQFAGSVNYFTLNNNTTAWIGSGAIVTQKASGANPWVVTLENGTATYQKQFTSALTVEALTHTESVNAAGNVPFSGTVGQGQDSSAVGGAFNVVTSNTNTIAGIANGATVTVNAQAATGGAGFLSVSARTEDFMLGIAPGGGEGTGIALNNIDATLQIDNTTHASISNLAIVSSPGVDIDATQFLRVYSVSGAIAASSEAGIGLSMAISQITTNTAAFVGDNHGDIASALDAGASGSGTLGSVKTDVLSVNATTYGVTTVAAIAGEKVDDSNVQPDGSPNMPPPGTPAKAMKLLGAAASKAKFGLAISGSNSIEINSLTTSAYLANASIDRLSPAGSTQTAVNALNNVLEISVSGAAALDAASPAGATKSFTAAIAGALAIAVSDNSTSAYISGSTLRNAKSVSVQALTGGLEVVVGLGVAVNKNSNKSKSASVAGSISVASITDGVSAYIDSSTVSGVAGATGNNLGDVTVSAYRATNIGIGAGSLYYGGKGGFGLAVTYAAIGDPSSGYATDAHITNSSVSGYANVDVTASDPARIYSGAAMVGLMTDNGLGGTVVVADIGDTTSARIQGTTTQSATVTASGGVTVIANDTRNAAYDSALGSPGMPPSQSGTAGIAPDIDFQAVSVQDVTDPGSTVIGPGAAIVSVAGLVQVGRSGNVSVGVGVIDSYVHQTHSALIAEANVTATGAPVAVSAIDGTSILTIGIGVGVHDGGKFDGQAAITSNRIDSTVLAQIGDDDSTTANTQLNASNLLVGAQDGAIIRSAALVVTYSGNAAGLSTVYDNIANTVSAGVTAAKVITTEDTQISAVSTADVLNIAVGVAISKGVGIAGSIATNEMDTNVSAFVTGAADISAGNNVLVRAANTDQIGVVAGAFGLARSTLGVGISVITNQIGGDTTATIDGNSLVDAKGLGSSGALAIDSGVLQNSFDVSSAILPSLSGPDFSEKQKSVSGLAVVATSHQSTVTYAVTLGIAFGMPSLGIALVPVFNEMSGLTKAAIDDAQIDTRLTGAASATGPQIAVIASSQSFSANFIIAGGFSSYAGAGANAKAVMDRQTLAGISSSNVGVTPASVSGPALGAVDVAANASQTASSVVVGFAAGVNAAAASGVVNIFDADTRALVDRGTMTAASLNVTADSANSYFAAAGAGAAGSVGLAGSFVVGLSENTTVASVGDANATTLINLSGGLTIASSSENTFTTYAIGGALAGGVGIAGMAAVTIVANTTTAGLYGATVTQAAGATETDLDSNGNPVVNPAGVKILATESIDVTPKTGAGAVGITGSGVGAGANVVLLASALTAESVGSQISAPGALIVSAQGTKHVDAQTVTLGAGSGAGIGAAVGVVLLGASIPAEVIGDLDMGGNGTLTSVNAMSTANSGFLLSAAGLNAFRTDAATTSNPNPTDQQIQAYALTQYQALINNASISNGLVTLNTAGLTAFKSAAATALGVANPTNGQIQAYANTLYQKLISNDVNIVLSASGVPQFAQAALGSADYASFTQLLNNGTAQGSSFALSSDGIAFYRPIVAAALNIPLPTDQQVQDYASAQYLRFVQATQIYADTQYNNLLAAGVVASGKLTLNTSAIPTYVQSALSATDYTAYQQLIGSGAVQGSTFVLNSSALATYRPLAATALNIANPTDQQVQDYANGLYAGYIQATRDYANNQYWTLKVDSAAVETPYSVSAALGGSNDGVTASIASGTVTAGSVIVSAGAQVRTNNMVTGVGVGGGAGVGAAVGYTRVYDTVTASVAQASVNTANLNITAAMADMGGSAAQVQAYAGAGSLTAGAGAAVADTAIENKVTAALGGTVAPAGGGTAPVIAVTADDNSSARGDAFGATVSGGVALGVSLANVTKNSFVTAEVLPFANVTGSSLALGATSEGATYAETVAGVGGLFIAGNGSAANATNTSNVTAEIGASAIDVGSGAVSVTATNTGDVKALALGVTVSGNLAVGVSIASATVSPTVSALVDDGAEITAGALNITATSTYGGAVPGTVPTASFPASTALPGSTDDFTAGGTSAAAWAIAGVGAVFVSADGTVSNASNTSNVTAKIGDNVVLPDGTISIAANNLTNQVTNAIGVAVAGLLAIGDVQASSTSNTTTVATLGSGSTTTVSRDGDLTIVATGYDYNSAKAIAGSGGLLAGSGAEASTSSTSTMSAGIGDGTAIAAGSVTISALHLTGFKSIVDSLNAAALGASASNARNDASSDVTVNIGNGTGLILSGGLTLSAQNKFAETGTDDSARAAAGGGINGTGATSFTTLTGNANINIGDIDNVGPGAVVMAGAAGITMLASSYLVSNDTVSLQTGGLLQGAGVNSKIDATLNSAVTVGDSTSAAPTEFITPGNINIGTYTEASASTMALVSTYGLASIGDANATTRITADQNVTIGANTLLRGIGTVNITPGLDTVTYRLTNLNGNSDAEGYVYGLIAIPGANATTAINSNAAVDVKSGARIESATDITIGAYHGSPSLNVDAAGHGYELGFIPVTISGGAKLLTTKADVTIDGNVTAGIYHDQEIVIGCGVATCGVNSPATFQLLSGAPVTVNGLTVSAPGDGQQATPIASQGFNPTAYVNAKFDPEVAPIMLLGVSSGSVPAFMIGPLYAAGGNITINADKISGAGQLTAYGGPKINVVNTTSAYVILESAYIPNVPGGQVFFTGTAQRQNVGTVALNESIDPSGPLVSINMSYAGPSLAGSTSGPALLISGDVSNIGGPVALSNATGWMGQLGSVLAASVSETAPNGGLVVSAVNPGQMYNANSFPYYDWINFMSFPGSTSLGAPGFSDPTALHDAAQMIAAYVANLFAASLPTNYDPTQLPSSYSLTDILNLRLYGVGGNAVPVGVFPFVIPTTPITGNTSYAFFGNCVFNFSGSCGAGVADSKSLLGSHYVLTPYSSTQDDTHSVYEPTVPFIISRGLNGIPLSTAYNQFELSATSYSFANINTSPIPKTYGTPGLVQAFGGPVAIKADIINVNGTIEAGRPNSWSVALPQSLVAAASTATVLDHYAINFDPFTFKFSITPIYKNIVTGGGAIAQYALEYQLGQQSLTSGSHLYSNYENLSPTFAITGLSSVNAGDQLIGATYNAASNTISLADTNASSGGGFVLLDGKIINTSPAPVGNINVNGGLGQVTVNNQTGIALIVNAINTGSTVNNQPVVSRVKIVDRLQPDATNTTTYLFTPGQGISVYQTGFGTDPILTGANATTPTRSTTDSSATYVPITGARFEWSQQAELTRDLASNGDWAFLSTQTGGNPWYFLDANGNRVTDLNAQGRVVVDPTAQPVFKETMSATVVSSTVINYGYGGCDSGGSCNYSFRQTDCGSTQCFGRWFYDFPTDIRLTLTSSVKADNPFAINFSGNATAFLNITSNASVTLAGRVTNPSGTTSIAVSGANNAVSQAQNAVFSTGNLSLASSGAIGSSDQAINAVLSSGAVVKAQAGTAGAYLRFDSAALIDQVVAGSAQTGFGNVSITATGDILRAPVHFDGSAMASADVNIIGNNITLTSTLGGVGTGANPLAITANSVAKSDGSVSGGVVTVNALGDVGLTQTSGDMRVGSVVTNGDAYLNVLSGSLVDASGKTSSSTLSDDQVAAIKGKLHLTVADGATQAAQDYAVTAFENLFNRDYTQYFSLLGNGNVSKATPVDTNALASVLDIYRPLAEAAQTAAARQLGVTFQGTQLAPLTDAQVLQFAANLVAQNGTFTLSGAALAFYRPQAAAALQITAPTDAQVQAYANAQFQSYANVFAQGVGANWASLSQFQQLNSAYRFQIQAGSALATTLTTGSVWTANQLISAVNASPTAVGNTVATIAARNVTLSATGGGIGRLSDPTFIDLASLQTGSLNSGQLRALAASSPGSVTVVGSDGRQYAPGDLPNGVQAIGVNVGQTAPVFVSLLESAQATATGSIFLQATALPNTTGDTLRITKIQSGGDVSLVAPQSIVAAPGADPVQIVASGNLALVTDQSNQGSLGDSSTPLTYQIGGKLTAATAGKDINLKAVGGDTTIGVVSAKGDVSITDLDGGIFASVPGIAVTGNNVSLVALGDIGTSLQPLTLQVGANGAFSGSTQGSAFIEGLTPPDAPSLSTLTVSGFSAVTGLTLGADGALVIGAGGFVGASNGAVNVLAASLSMGAGSQLSGAAGIDLHTTGSLLAESLLSVTGDIKVKSDTDAAVKTASISDAVSGKITLQAAGTLDVATASAAGLIDVTSGGLFTLASGGQLASRTNKVTIDSGAVTMGTGSQLSAATGIIVHTAGSLVAETLATASGDIDVRSGADASVKMASIADQVSGAITFAAAGALTAGSASSAGPVSVNAGAAFNLVAGGELLSRTGQVSVMADSVLMGQGSRIAAADRIGVTTTGDALLGQLASTLDPGANAAPVITVSAGSANSAGMILGNGDGQTNIKTVRPNAPILLTATAGIGTLALSIVVDVPILSAATTAGDINILALGSIKLPLLYAPLGSINFNATGGVVIDDLTGGDVKFSSDGDVTIGIITATKSVTIAGKTITTDIVQPVGSPSPLLVSLTGPHGGVAQSIVVNIDAPNGTNFTQLFAIDASVTTNSRKIGILNGFIAGKLELATPGQDIVLDNRSPQPVIGPTVQLYGPNLPFTLFQNNNLIVTSDFIVGYGLTSAVTALNVFDGMSFIRDFPRGMLNGAPLSVDEVRKDGRTFYVIGLSPSGMLDALAIPKSVESVGSGPAVNLDGLY